MKHSNAVTSAAIAGYNLAEVDVNAANGSDTSSRGTAMKRPHGIIGKTLLVSILSTGLGWNAGTAASDPMSGNVDHPGASSPVFLAQSYFTSDKPPYIRNTGYAREGRKERVEKSEFARLEEKPAGEKQQPPYRYVPGAKPPYERLP